MQNKHVYSFFDDIVCINLRSREDRRTYVTSVFKHLDIPHRFHTIEKSPKGGKYGCFESHIDVIRECYTRGCRRILIFEDDIKPTPEYSLHAVQRAIQFMETHPEWDLFYFGYFVANFKDSIFMCGSTEDSHIVRYDPFATHAYCVNRKAMETILHTYAHYIGKDQVDVYYSKLGLHCSIYVPMLFEQKLCMETDNPGTNMLETIFRKGSCTFDKTQFNYKVSKIVYALQHHVYVAIVCIFLTVILLSIWIHITQQKQ